MDASIYMYLNLIPCLSSSRTLEWDRDRKSKHPTNKDDTDPCKGIYVWVCSEYFLILVVV